MFMFGTRSEENLQGVDPRLVRCARRAIATTAVDFTVFEGLRTIERQRELVRNGVSRKLDSYHLTGHALDLVPWIAGRAQWQAPACIQIAVAMRQAAVEFGVPVTWGAVWDRTLVELNPAALDLAVENYVARYKATRGPRAQPLIDYPHFQVLR